MVESLSASKEFLKGPELSRQLFGGVLDYDGAGHYPGLELLNFVFGTVDENKKPVVLPESETVLLLRHSHDFARTLIWDEERFSHDERKEDVFLDDVSANAIRRMLECLQLEIPNSSGKSVTWERAHFFPYTRSLIHWDARKPRSATGNLLIERRYMRGAGALAFKTLRMDTNRQRLESCRAGFLALFSGSEESPLERMAELLRHTGVSDDSGKPDNVETKTTVYGDYLDDVYRNGIRSILQHGDLASVVRIRAVMRWTAYWLVLVQHRRAATYLGQGGSDLICDCGSNYAQLRRLSQRCLKEVQATIVGAVEKLATDLSGTVSRSSLNKTRGFFWSTAATIGLLNAWRGRRHFTLGIGILEALVMATTGPGEEISYEEFVSDRLYGELGLVVGRVAADRAGLLSSIDASVFEDNESQLAIQLEAAGLLTAYSDATRMIGTGGLR